MDAIERYRLRQLTDDQRIEYDERIAVCIEDGGLSEVAAQQIAWEQVRPHVAPVRPRPNRAPRGERMLGQRPDDATGANVVRQVQTGAASQATGVTCEVAPTAEKQNQ